MQSAAARAELLTVECNEIRSRRLGRKLYVRKGKIFFRSRNPDATLKRKTDELQRAQEVQRTANAGSAPSASGGKDSTASAQ